MAEFVALDRRIIDEVINRSPEQVVKDAFSIYERDLERYLELEKTGPISVVGNYRIDRAGNPYEEGAVITVTHTVTETVVLSAKCTDRYSEALEEYRFDVNNVTIDPDDIQPLGMALTSPLEKATLVADYKLRESGASQLRSGELLYVREEGNLSRTMVFATPELVGVPSDGYHFIAQQFDNGDITGSPYYQSPNVLKAIDQQFNELVEGVEERLDEQQLEQRPPIKITTVPESYVDEYGPDAPLVAAVYALGERGELFDQATYDTEVVNSFFYRVPDSTLIVNRVSTFDRGDQSENETYIVLDGDEPLFEVVRLGEGGIEQNDLTLSQIEALKTAQREGANPLLVNEAYFQGDIAQALTNDGQAQARAILSQGEAITPEMVASLNDLMAVEEDIRRQYQVEQGLDGEVRYPRYTVDDLNQMLSRDVIARQLSEQFPVVEAQVVAEPAVEAEQDLVSLVDTLSERGTLSRNETIGVRAFEGYTYTVPDSNLRIETLYENGPDLGDSSELLQLYAGIDLVLEARDRNVTLNTVTPEQQQLLSAALNQQQARPSNVEVAAQPQPMPSVADYLDATTPETVTETKTSVYDRPRFELKAMEAEVIRLLGEDYTLRVPGSEGNQIELGRYQVTAEGERLFYTADVAPGDSFIGNPQVYQEADLSKLIKHAYALEALHEGTLTTLSGTAVNLPDFTQLRAKESSDKAYIQSLLDAGERLSIRTNEGSTVLSMLGSKSDDRRFLLLQTYNRDGQESGHSFPEFEEALERTDALYAMEHGLMEMRDGTVYAPGDSRGAASPIPVSGQRETAAPEAPEIAPAMESPAPTPVKSPTPKPTLKTQPTQAQGTPMTTTLEAPTVKAEVQPVLLSDMMSRRSQDALRGICGLEGRGAQAEPRKPGEAFKALATDAYGVENFLKANGVEFKGSADYVVNKTALELGLSPEFKDQILDDVKREECVPRVVLATQKDMGELATDNVWRKVSQLSPSAYEAAAPAEVKGRLVEQATSLEDSKSAVLQAMGITLKPREAEQTQEAPKKAYTPRYQVAPEGEKTDRAIAFRDSLTVSQMREFQNALEVMGANQDTKNYAQDFADKFAKSGYRMNDGGISAGMVERLGKLQEQMGAVVPAYRATVKESFEQVLGNQSKVDAPKLGVEIAGKDGMMTVKDRETKQVQLLVKDGEVLINRVPPVVVGKVQVMADVSRQQQQQAAVAKPQPVKAGGGRD